MEKSLIDVIVEKHGKRSAQLRQDENALFVSPEEASTEKPLIDAIADRYLSTREQIVARRKKRAQYEEIMPDEDISGIDVGVEEIVSDGQGIEEVVEEVAPEEVAPVSFAEELIDKVTDVAEDFGLNATEVVEVIEEVILDETAKDELVSGVESGLTEEEAPSEEAPSEEVFAKKRATLRARAKARIRARNAKK